MPLVHHVMFLLMSMPLPLAEGTSNVKVDITREVSRRHTSDRSAPGHVIDSSKPKVMFVAERKYQEPEIAYAKIVLAVRQASSMQQILYLLPKDQRQTLKSQQDNWPNVKKWRIEYRKRDLKAGRTDGTSKDPRYYRSPYENELHRLKDTFDNVVDVTSCEIKGDKATLKVLTIGDVVRNDQKLHRTETVHMVRENGRWLYSHTRTGNVSVGFY